MDILNQSLNKGVPSLIIIPLPFSDIINISTNKERTNKILTTALLKYNERISEIIKKSIKHLYLIREAQVNTDVDTFEKYITVSDEFIFKLLVTQLNINHIAEKLEQNIPTDFGMYSEEKALERLSKLRRIKTEKQLKKEFPYLYHSYESFVNKKAEAMMHKRISPLAYFEYLKSTDSNKYDIELLENINTFPDYIKYMADSFEAMIENYEELSELAKEIKIDSRIFGFRSAEKLELFLANIYAITAHKDSIEIETKQKCAYYLSAYMFENADKLDDGVTIQSRHLNYEGKITDTITKRKVYECFRKLLINNPELFNVNFDYHIFTDMSQEEIDALMKSYLETLKLQWDIIPNGEELLPPKEITDKTTNSNNTQKRKGQTKQDISELFYQKKAFFDASEPLIRVMGKDTFNGYIGYIYPNGSVVLDKYYEDAQNKKLAKDVAIYSMGIDDFYRLSQLSKSEIIRDRLCKRFYHRGDWQSRVQKEITGEVDSDIYQKTKVLKDLSEYQQ